MKTSTFTVDVFCVFVHIVIYLGVIYNNETLLAVFIEIQEACLLTQTPT